eukprot:435171_1
MNGFRVIISSLLVLLGGNEIRPVWGDPQHLRGTTRLRSIAEVSILNGGYYRLDARGLAVEVSTTGSVGYSRSFKPVNLGATKLSDGKVAIVWESFGEDRSMLSIMGTEFDPLGEGSGSATIINQYTEGDQSLPYIVSLAGGGRAVVWQSYSQDGSSWGIYDRVFNADGSATDENVVPVTNLDAQRFGVLSALPADILGEELPGGGAVVAWRGFVPGDDGVAHIFLRFISADGVAQGGEIQVDGTGGVALARPSALTLKDGSGIFVSWADVSGYIYGRLLIINGDGTTTWNGSPFQISQLEDSRIDFSLAGFTLYSQYSPVTLDSTELDDGTIIVTWLGALGGSNDGIVYGIHVNPSTGTIDPEFALSADASFSPSVATVSSDTDGSGENLFVIGWASQTSSYFEVGKVAATEQGDSHSILLGKIIQVNAEGSQAGSPAAVLGLDELTFVVAYSVFEDDGTASIISHVYEMDLSEINTEETPTPPPTPPPNPTTAPTTPNPSPVNDSGDDVVGGSGTPGSEGDSTLAIALGVSLGAIALIALGGGGYIYYKHHKRSHNTATPST